MKRVLILLVFGTILSTCNVVFANQQSPVYASQAGTMQPYNPNQNNNNNNNNGYNNSNNQGYNNGQYYNNQQNQYNTNNQQGNQYSNSNQQYNNNQYNNNNQQNNNNQYSNNNQQNNQYYNNNQQNNNGYNNSNNNNTNNWTTQFANQYGVNNNNVPTVTNVSYNNQNQNGYYNNQNNNNNNNNTRTRSANNPFLNNYARKDKKFSASVYKVNNNGTLYKTKLDSKSLQKAIVIFFGDWCPHCANFLTSLSKYINQLISSGIKIIFISVPSIERIQNWQIPTIADYNEAQQKLRSFNIIPEQLNQYAQNEYNNAKQQKKNKQQYNHDILSINMPAVEVVLLGDNSVLDNNAIDSLPTMLAINNGTEQFRGGSDNSLDVVNFENSITMQQFNEIWYENDEEDDDNETDDEEDEDDDEEEEKPKKKVKKKKKSNTNKSTGSKKKTTNKKSNKKQTKHVLTNVDKNLANFHTKMLNKGCQCSCNPTPVVVKRKKAKIVQPVVKKNIEVVEEEQFIEGEEEEEVVPVQVQRGKCIKQHRPVMCKLKRSGKLRNRIETAVEKHEGNRCNCR